MADKYNVLAARVLFELAGKTFPYGEVEWVNIEWMNAYSGGCDTCSFEYSYPVVTMMVDGRSFYAEVDRSYITMSEILERMAEFDEND